MKPNTRWSLVALAFLSCQAPRFEGVSHPPRLVLPPGGGGRSLITLPIGSPVKFEVAMSGPADLTAPMAVMSPCLEEGGEVHCEVSFSTSLETSVGTSWIASFVARGGFQGTATARVEIAMADDPTLEVNLEAFFKDAVPGTGSGFGSGVILSGDSSVAMIRSSRASLDLYARSDAGWLHDARIDGPPIDSVAVLSRNGSLIGISGRADGGPSVRTLMRAPSGWREDAQVPNADALLSVSDDGTWLVAAADGWNSNLLLTRDVTGIVAVQSIASPNEFGIGTRLSGDGSTLAFVVSDDGSSGDRILVFRRLDSLWSLDATLTPPPGRKCGMGLALSFDGSTLVSANFWEPPEAGAIVNSGSARVFQRSDGVWHQQAFLRPDPPFTWQQFGYDLALSSDGNTLVVGASIEPLIENPDGGIIPNGAVYVFTRQGEAWARRRRVTVPAGVPGGGYFGQALSCSGDGRTLLVGEPGGSTGSPGINGDIFQPSPQRSGAAYLFRVTEVR